MKKNICIFILSALIFSSITAYATTTYYANQIKYIKSNNQEVTLDSALNELYSDASTTIGELQTSLNACNNKPLQLRFAFLSNNSGHMRISPFADKYAYYNIELEGKDANALCSVSARDVNNTLYSITFKQDYSTTYLNISDLRVEFKATTGWCTFKLNLHN